MTQKSIRFIFLHYTFHWQFLAQVKHHQDEQNFQPIHKQFQ
jgi:hypothetical protein